MTKLHSGSSLSAGDPVWWQGPYVVTKRINDLVYCLTRSPILVHRDWLWHYTGSNPPTWFDAMLESTPVTPTTYPVVARKQKWTTAVTWTPPLICSQEVAVARGANSSGMAQMFSSPRESVN